MIETVLTVIRNTRLDLSDEKRTQADLAHALTAQGIAFEREVRLSAADIPDFMVGDIAIEVKIRGARKMDIYRQLVRYAKHERVGSLILATNMTMGLPEQLEGKPVFFVALGRAWL
jgi:hypothetical protein